MPETKDPAIPIVQAPVTVVAPVVATPVAEPNSPVATATLVPNQTEMPYVPIAKYTNPAQQNPYIVPTAAPQQPRLVQPNYGHYIWAVVGLILIGAVFTFGILFIRPTADPLTILGSVMTGLLPTVAAVMAFIKAQETNEQAKETHLSVNSRLDAFIKQHEAIAFNKGEIQGTEDTRVAMHRAYDADPPVKNK